MSYLASAATDTTHTTQRWRKLWLPVLFCLVALVFESYWIFHDLDHVSGATTGAAGPPLATYVQGSNQVRFKSAGTITWLKPEKQGVLRGMDSIATMADSRAVIEFLDHSEIEVEPESLIVLEEAPTAKGVTVDGRPMASAPSGRIVARLVRGSVTRKKSGSAPLLIKLSDQPAGPVIRFDDQRGDAVFRVVRHGFGIEVVVESGTVSVNGKASVGAHHSARVEGASLNQISVERTPPPPAPILKTPHVQIEQRGGQSRAKIRWPVWSWIEQANADEGGSGVDVLVEFAWEKSDGATSYRIQVAKDPDFHNIVVDETVQGLRYGYRATPDSRESKVYFRVAAIGSDGAQGAFSTNETVTIRPEKKLFQTPISTQTPLSSVLIEPTPTPSLRSTLEHKPKSRSKPGSELKTKRKRKVRKNKHSSRHQKELRPEKPSSVKNQSEPKPSSTGLSASPPPSSTAPITDHEKEVSTGGAPSLPKQWFLESGYGAGYRFRSFKSDGRPSSAAGSGWTPIQIDLDLSLFKPRKHYYQVEFSVIPEGAQPVRNGSPYDSMLNVTDLRARGAVLKPWKQVYWGVGPYLSTTSRISWNDSHLDSSQKLVLGLSLSLSADPVLASPIQWQVEVNPLIVGDPGADLRVRARKRIQGFFTWRSWFDDSGGAFLGVDGVARLSRDENGVGMALEAGYVF